MNRSLLFLLTIPFSVAAAQVDYAAVKTLPTIVSGALLSPTGDTVRYSGTGGSHELVKLALNANVCHRTVCIAWTDSQNYTAFSKSSSITHVQLEGYITYLRENESRMGTPGESLGVAAVIAFDLNETGVDITQFNINEVETRLSQDTIQVPTKLIIND